MTPPPPQADGTDDADERAAGANGAPAQLDRFAAVLGTRRGSERPDDHVAVLSCRLLLPTEPYPWDRQINRRLADCGGNFAAAAAVTANLVAAGWEAMAPRILIEDDGYENIRLEVHKHFGASEEEAAWADVRAAGVREFERASAEREAAEGADSFEWRDLWWLGWYQQEEIDVVAHEGVEGEDAGFARLDPA